jgi:hypothetical protein
MLTHLAALSLDFLTPKIWIRARHWQLTPVILTTWEDEIRRISVQDPSISKIARAK